MSNEYLPPQSDVTGTQEMENPPLLSPHGRIGRIRYLAHGLWMTSVIYLVGFGVIFAAAGISESLVGIATAIVTVAALAVMFLLAIKRSHDINLSGWWSLLSLVPLANLFFVFKSGTPEKNDYGLVPKPNTALLWIGGLAFPIVFFIGMLSAIAVPAYQDYTSRAQIGEGMAAAVSYKSVLADFYQPRGYWPAQTDLVELGLNEPTKSLYATIHAHADTGVIEVVMDDESTLAASIANGSLLFTPYVENNVLKFKCTSAKIDQRFLPNSCKEP